MEDVKRLSGLVQVNPDGFCRKRKLLGQERLAHLRDGGTGFLADRRLDWLSRFRRSGNRQSGESYEKKAKRSYLSGIP
jgi:hypothetical protein